MKKLIFAGILMAGLSMMLFANPDTNPNSDSSTCVNMVGHWYGEGSLSKTIECVYEVDAYVGAYNPNSMLLNMRKTSSNPLCKQYYSEEVVLNCDQYYLSMTNQKITVTGHITYDHHNAYLTGALHSRLHYHQFELNLHKN